MTVSALSNKYLGWHESGSSTFKASIKSGGVRKRNATIAGRAWSSAPEVGASPHLPAGQ